jgi:transposase
MRQKSGPPKETSDQAVKDIRRATRKRYSAEEKIKDIRRATRKRYSAEEKIRGRLVAERPLC